MRALAIAVMMLFAVPEIIVDTTKVTSPQMFVSGSRKVVVTKSGDTTFVRVQEGDRVDEVSIRREGDKVIIGQTNNGVARRFIVPDRPRILVDGIDLEPYLGGAVREAPPPAPRRQDPPRFYICPNDEATLRVRPGTPEGKYKCPLDGAVMRSGVGPGRQYWLLE